MWCVGNDVRGISNTNFIQLKVTSAAMQTFVNNNIRLMIKLDKTRETLKFEVNIQETIYKVTVC
jgi:hypothetical protein